MCERCVHIIHVVSGLSEWHSKEQSCYVPQLVFINTYHCPLIYIKLSRLSTVNSKPFSCNDDIHIPHPLLCSCMRVFAHLGSGSRICMHSSSHSFHKMTQVQVILPCKLDQYGEASIIGSYWYYVCIRKQKLSISRQQPCWWELHITRMLYMHQLLHKNDHIMLSSYSTHACCVC